MLQQLSGVNGILFYAASIFKAAGKFMTWSIFVLLSILLCTSFLPQMFQNSDSGFYYNWDVLTNACRLPYFGTCLANENHLVSVWFMLVWRCCQCFIWYLHWGDNFLEYRLHQVWYLTGFSFLTGITNSNLATFGLGVIQVHCWCFIPCCSDKF